jgi:hypothetical protein
MDLAGLGWGLQTIIGGFLLFAVLMWVVLKNKKAKNGRAESELGARRVYEESERVRRSGDDAT